MEYLSQKIEVPNKTHDILNEFYEKEYKRILQELIKEIEEEIGEPEYKILKKMNDI
jgi:hypothetical protein